MTPREENMGEVKAGVVVVTKFCNAGSAKFQSYIDYIDREEAVRTENSSKYNLYQDYMGNPEKTTGIFTQSNDELTMEQKQQLKAVFEIAQDNGSLMWQTVISFDNRWLAENGLYRKEDNILDEKALKDVARNAIGKMLKAEKLENAVWSAAIHFNTDNIHIHVATVEPEPMREKKTYIQYEKGVTNDTRKKVPMRDEAGNVITREEYKGTFKPKSIEICKSTVVNQIIREQDNNLKINRIIRDSIVKQKKSHPLTQDKDMVQSFLALYNKMPDCPKNMWNYNNPVMATVRDDIDNIITNYLEKYHENEYQELKNMLAQQDTKYQKAYGGEQVKYSEGKLKDLYSRMGNAVLKEIREFDKEVKKGKSLEQIINIESQGVINDTYETSIPHKEQNQVEQIEKEYISSVDRNETISIDLDDDSSWDGMEENREDNFLGFTEKKSTEKVHCEWSKEFKKARKAMRGINPDYQYGLKTLEREHDKGNVLATYELGDALRYGRGVEIDNDKAENYYQKSLEGFRTLLTIKNNNSGRNLSSYYNYRIGKQFYYGLGVEQSYEAALNYFETSGNIYSKYMIGRMTYAGEGVEQSKEEAFKIYCSISEENGFAAYNAAMMIAKGEVDIEENAGKTEGLFKTAYTLFSSQNEKNQDENLEYKLGVMCINGQGTEKDPVLAEKYFFSSSKAGNIYAMNRLAKIYIETGQSEKVDELLGMLKKVVGKSKDGLAEYTFGEIYAQKGFKQFDINEAIAWYSKAEEKGYSLASYKLGKIYYSQENYIEAVKCFENSQSEYGYYNLGKIYANEQSGLYDEVKAVENYLKAEELGNTFASYQLGKIYYAQEQYEKAVKCFQKSDTEYGYYNLGKIYMDEQSGLYNEEKAIKNFLQAEELGNVFASYQLGKIYYVQENDKEAINHFQMCDNDFANYYIGKIYLNTDSELYNPALGMHYMLLSAKEDNAYAEFNIGVQYLKGEIVERDIVEAQKWLYSSVSHGNVIAEDILKNIHEYKPIERMSSKHMGMSLASAIRRMQQGLRNEWQRRENIRQHEQLLQKSREKEQE